MTASEWMLSETTVLSVTPIAVVSVVDPRLSTSVRVAGSALAPIVGDEATTRATMAQLWNALFPMLVS